MKSEPRLFWDSSALIDAVLAPDDSPYYELFDLGESGAVDMRVSPDVIRESEAIFRKHGGNLVTLLALALHNANFATTSAPNKDTIDQCERLTGYRNDARVLAAAEECLADIFITHDKAHFLGNPLLGPPDTHCRIMTAEEALDWLSEQMADGSDQAE
jgi:predicted nucleic acid-binding protein